MNFLDMLKNGFQPQPEPVNEFDPYQNQLALRRAADMRNRGVSMQQTPYQGGANPLGLIAGLATMLRGRNLERRGDESITAAMKRQFELDNERAAKEAKAAAEKEERDFNRAIEKARKIAEAEAEARRRFESPKGPVKVGRSLVQVGEDGKPVVLYRDPEAARAPERVTYGAPIEMMGPDGKPIMVRPASDGSIVPIEGYAPPKKPEAPLTAADVKLIQGEEQRIASADNVLGIIDKLREASKEGVGGPIAASSLNPFTNRATPAGQAIMRYDSLAAGLSDEITRLMRIPGIGAQSNVELEAALKAIPTSNMPESTRLEILDQIANRVKAIKNAPRFQDIRSGQSRGPSQSSSDDELILKYLNP